MDNPTDLHILDSLDELVHNERDLTFLKLVCFDMLKQLTTADLLHHDVDMVLSFKRLTHLNDIGVGYQAYNLVLLPQEVFLFVGKRPFVDQFHSHIFQGFSVLALPNSAELTISQFAAFLIFIFEIKVVTLLLQAQYPLVDHRLRLVIQGFDLQIFIFRRHSEPEQILALEFCQIYEETSQEYHLRRDFLLSRMVNEKGVISKDVIPVDKQRRLITNFAQNSFFNYYRIFGYDATSFAVLRRSKDRDATCRPFGSFFTS